MKKLIVIVLALCLCLSLAACGGTDEPKPVSEPAPEPTAEPAPVPTPESTQDNAEELLSAPYVKMFESGDYQFTRSVVYQDEPYQMITAAKNGMFCRKLVSADGTKSNRIVTIDGAAWQVNDATGAVKTLSAEDAAAEAQPYCGAEFSFVAATTLDTGYIAEAYAFDYQGTKYNIMFVLSQEGELVMLIPTVNEETTQMEIIEMTSPADEALFQSPEIEETPLKQNEVFGIGGLLYMTVGEAYTYDDDLFLDEAGSGYQWLGVSVFLKNVSGETLAPFTEFITGAGLIHGADTYEASFSEANPKGSDYAETLKDIEPDTEIEAFMKFKIPAGLSVSDGFTLCFTIGETFYSCEIK